MMPFNLITVRKAIKGRKSSNMIYCCCWTNSGCFPLLIPPTYCFPEQTDNISFTILLDFRTFLNASAEYLQAQFFTEIILNGLAMCHSRLEAKIGKKISIL